MKLEEVLTYQKGKSPGKDSITDNLILYLTPEYLRGNGRPNFIPDFPSKIEVEDKDLLLLWDGSNAGEFFKGKKGYLSSTMVKFQFDEEEYLPEFLFYQLKAFEAYLKAQTNGSGIPHVDKELLLGIEIEKFDKPEQTRIAQILSTADKAIEQTEKLIAKYQRTKTGLMQDLLTRGIDEHGNIRSKATHKFVVKNGIEVPEEWEVVQLDSVLKKKEYGISVSLDDEEGTPVLRMNNLKEGEINFEDLKFSQSHEAKALLVNPNDVLFNRTNSIDYVGRTSIFKRYEEPISFASYLVRLVTNKFIIPDFLNCILNFPFYQIQLKQFATIAVQQANINPTNLGKMYIALPDKKEQLKVVELLTSNKRIINSQERNLHKLQSLKTGLMQDLLSGKVRVKTNPL